MASIGQKTLAHVLQLELSLLKFNFRVRSGKKTDLKKHKHNYMVVDRMQCSHSQPTSHRSGKSDFCYDQLCGDSALPSIHRVKAITKLVINNINLITLVVRAKIFQLVQS